MQLQSSQSNTGERRVSCEVCIQKQLALMFSQAYLLGREGHQSREDSVWAVEECRAEIRSTPASTIPLALELAARWQKPWTTAEYRSVQRRHAPPWDRTRSLQLSGSRRAPAVPPAGVSTAGSTGWSSINRRKSSVRCIRHRCTLHCQAVRSCDSGGLVDTRVARRRDSVALSSKVPPYLPLEVSQTRTPV